MALSLMLMQECCNPLLANSFCQWENEPCMGCAYTNKALITLVNCEIFHSPYLTLTPVISLCVATYLCRLVHSEIVDQSRVLESEEIWRNRYEGISRELEELK